MFPSFDKAPSMQIKNSSQRHSSINSINFKVVLVSSYFWKIYKLVAKEKKNKILNFRRKRFPTATVERIKKKRKGRKKERKKKKQNSVHPTRNFSRCKRFHPFGN